MDAHARLKEAISGGQAIVVAGTGVSAASTGGASTSTWAGLIQNGIDFVRRNDPVNAERWIQVVEGQLDLAMEEDEPDQLLQAASQVSARILRIGQQAFATWLEESVGSLTLEDASWARAIAALASPIFTTNYDLLFEAATQRATVDWEDPKAIQQILSRTSTSVGHLHGRFDRAGSVVLSEADYQRLVDSEGAQALQRAMSSSRSMLYIGCGSTLEDPNLGRLLRWHRDLFPDSGVEHFRLCRASEFDKLTREHANDNITVIAYGSEYSELPAFLEGLRPGAEVSVSTAGIVKDPVHDAREYLLDQLRREAIVGEAPQDEDDRDIADVVIPPVLLPVPHAEFFRARSPEEKRPKRLDPSELVSKDQVILLVADENGGLSTALKWLLHEGSRQRSRVAPLLLDFRRFPQGVGPLRGQSKVEAYHRGVIDSRRADLPATVTGVDDFHGHSKTSVRTAEDLITFEGLTILATHSVYEAESVEVLRAAGVEPVVAYLGRLATSDIKAMVRLVSPGQVDTLSEVVLATMRAEHLPRTPFTVALLVSILMRGEALVANASPTTILEQYVSHLLGRDGIDEDPRFALTSTDREAMLTDLARLFVEMDQGSMLQSEVTERMQNFFERLGWSESPTQVLTDLGKRRVLSFDGTQVRFTQSSFLHLFAAKAAMRRSETLDSMLERPLYYSPVIRAYAGLVRHDGSVLQRLEYLLDEALKVEVPLTALAQQEVLAAPDDLDQRLANNADAIVSAGERPAEPDDDFDDEDTEPIFDDKDVLPFPLTTDADLGRLERVMGSVDLVSGVLRDSEEVEDLDLKRAMLMKTLRTWGLLTDVFLADESFQESLRTLGDTAREYFDDESEIDSAERFVRILPGIIVWSGISMSLASRKLTLILDQVLADVDVENDPAVSIPAAIMVNAIHQARWYEKYGHLMKHHERTWIAREVMFPMLMMEYQLAQPGSADEKQILELAVRSYIANFKFKDYKHERATADAFARQLSKLKGLGQLSADAEPDEFE